MESFSNFFVPSGVWRQNGAKINGYNVKLVAFQEIYETLETLHNTPLPSDGTSYKLMYNRGATNESVAKFQNVFSNCCVKILNIQTNLHRTFSYIPGVDKQLMKNDYGKGGGGSVFSGVKNFMTTAYERTTHTVVISRTTADDLEKIALVGASICEKAQFLDGKDMIHSINKVKQSGNNNIMFENNSIISEIQVLKIIVLLGTC